MTLSDFTLTNVNLESLDNVKEYKLMYLFGAWITSTKIYASSDKEAIFDANEAYSTAKGKEKLRFALFQGNKEVKEF